MDPTFEHTIGGLNDAYVDSCNLFLDCDWASKVANDPIEAGDFVWTLQINW